VAVDDGVREAVGEIVIPDGGDGQVELIRIDARTEDAALNAALEDIGHQSTESTAPLADDLGLFEMPGLVEILVVDQRQELGMLDVIVQVKVTRS